MLQELVIKDFAIISDLKVPFHNGMTALTGETGAGKSIIIDAVGLLVGGRGSADFVRQRTEKSVLEGQFFVGEMILEQVTNELAELGIEMLDDSVIMSRTIFASGKNICRINNHLVNTQGLKKIGQYLVDIHGQHEHQSLMNAERHIIFLDQYAINSLGTIKPKYQEIYQRYREIEKRLAATQVNEKELAQRMDMLTFQKNEIEEAKLEVGEEDRLKAERELLMNYQKITDALQNSYKAIQGDEFSSLSQIGQAMNEMAGIKEFSKVYEELHGEIASSYYQLEEATRALQNELDVADIDEERINFIEERLNLIRQLKRKYGDSEESILHHYDEVIKELSETNSKENQHEHLENELKKTKADLQKIADELTGIRISEKKQLEKEIIKQLKDLYLEKTIFKVEVTKGEFHYWGQDEVEFFISTNPGEPPKSLVKVASGGELSRVMLALKSIFSQVQGITSIVFDEVDTGVSGRVAQAIASKIHSIAEGSQVLCITHLPQVAAAADQQYFIEKKTQKERTYTYVSELSETDRVNEIARMLAGEKITELSIKHARELLELARNK